MTFTRKDLIFSVITGFIVGAIAYGIFSYLQAPKFDNWSYAWLMLVIPILWIAGVNLGYFLGRWFGFFNQFGKFAVIGFTNASVDFGLLYLLIAYFGVVAGIWYPVAKAVSFIVATLHSYVWNKYWVFSAGDSERSGSEFLKFISVSVMALIVNVAVATVVVNWVHPIFNIQPAGWAGFGAIIGSAVALIFSFTGFRFAVFVKD